MSPTVMAIIMIVVVVAAIIWNKIPMNFIMFVIPVVCALILGYNVSEISSAILGQISSVMGSSGWMLLFGLIFFTMLTESGMFDIIIGKLLGIVGKKLNVFWVLILTAAISAIAYLTANMSTTYLIVFPIMIPLFKRYKMDQCWAFIVCQSAIAMMCWLPWGIGVVNSAAMASTAEVAVSAEQLATESIPYGLTILPVIILQALYFSMQHKKKYGTLEAQAEEVADANAPKQEKEFARPKLFWFNLIVFVAVVLVLAVWNKPSRDPGWKIPSYLVFILGSIVLAMVNYPKDFGKIWNKSGMTFYNVLIMLIAICFYLAIFNIKKDGTPSMVDSLAGMLTSIFPSWLISLLVPIFLLLCVPIIRYVPYQVYNAMYPMLIAMGATRGILPIAVIAPFVCQIAFATSATLMNSATFVGCSLCEQDDVAGYVKYASPIMFVSNAIPIVICLLLALMKVGVFANFIW